MEIENLAIQQQFADPSSAMTMLLGNALGKHDAAEAAAAALPATAAEMNVIDRIIAMASERMPMLGATSVEEHFRGLVGTHIRIRKEWARQFGAFPANVPASLFTRSAAQQQQEQGRRTLADYGTSEVDKHHPQRHHNGSGADDYGSGPVGGGGGEFGGEHYGHEADDELVSLSTPGGYRFGDPLDANYGSDGDDAGDGDDAVGGGYKFGDPLGGSGGSGSSGVRRRRSSGTADSSHDLVLDFGADGGEDASDGADEVWG
jgi:hypothetical protein